MSLRVVAATHRDLEAEVRRGRFREDLFHRLAVVTLRLPPLRDRGADLGLLATHLLARASSAHQLHPEALTVLARHSWPGNVRELDNVLRAAALLVEGTVVTPEVLERLLAERGRQVRRRPQRDALGPRSQALLASLGSRWRSAPDLARDLAVSPRTVNRELKVLVDRGLVEIHGEARARTYRRTTHR